VLRDARGARPRAAAARRAHGRGDAGSARHGRRRDRGAAGAARVVSEPMTGARSELHADVALANRILERMGLSHAFGHASARIPGTDTFLLPTRRSPGLAAADNLLVIDTEGRVVAGDGEPNSEFWIHARLYAARPDVGGIVHAHPPSCVCLTQIGEPHRVVHNQGGIFAGGVPEYSRIGLVRSRELGDLLARTLGDGVAAMM